MALVVTPGAANADSYASLATAASYATAVGSTAWAGTDASKEAALRRATSWLDGAYAGRWPGFRVNGRSQSLEWPRVGAYDAEIEWIDSATIPVEVVNATCEAALREILTPGVLSPDVTLGTAKVLTGLKGISWTPLRGSVSAADMAPTLNAVDRLLARIVGTATGIKYLDRA